ncbi:hypothetical protein ACIQ9J_01315 [Streptomyces sp. NPDC094153]|uniref:hypothetical protein n=1 Tax=Streptomyces sp. NPDC094153 TaxID=3366058 RepID=UPI003815FFAA
MTSLSLDTTTLDTDNGHSNTTNNSRYIAQVPGMYLVCGSVGFTSTSGGDRRIQIALNGAAVIGSGNSMDPSQAVQHGLQTSAIVTMNGTTDYVEVQAAQSTASALSTLASNVFCSGMRVVWIGR